MSARLTGLTTGTRYNAAIVAVDASGNQSPCSQVASGVARIDFAVSPTGTVNYGTVNIGSFAERTFTLSNTGGGTVSGAVSVAAPFSVVSGSSFTLAGTGATQAVTVRFTPTTTTTVSTSVTFTAADGSVSDVVTGSGAGTTQPPPPPPTTPPPPSSSLTIGSRVRTTLPTFVRDAADGNVLATQPVGALGTVVGGPRTQIWQGQTILWWQIDYDTGLDGWSTGDRLVAVAPLPPPPPTTPPPTTPPPSSSPTIGSRVRTTLPTFVRDAADGNVLATQPVGALGTVVGGPRTQIWQGQTILWWQIDYDTGLDGWSTGDRLVAVALPPVMTIGSRIQVVNQVMNVRATPGGTLRGTQPVGALGRIVGGPQLAAISGSGSTTRYTYWRIDYDTGVDGWSRGDRLAFSQQSSATPPTTGAFAQVIDVIDGGTISRASISTVTSASHDESPHWALADRSLAQTCVPGLLDFLRPPDVSRQTVRLAGIWSAHEASSSSILVLRGGNVDWRRHALWISTRPIDRSSPRAG
jgi:hypothetical protein